jgi:Bacteriophage HK97-gp10, putative tail-component
MGYSVNTYALRAKVAEFGAAVVEEAVQRLSDDVHATVPVGEDDPLGRRQGGTLRDSRWGPRRTGPYTWEFGYTAEHGKYVDQGTDPHWIIGDPLLVFWWGKTGKVEFRSYVMHPGYSPAFRWWSDVVTPDNYFDHLEAAMRHARIG